MTREELNLLVQRYLDGEADEAECERVLELIERDAEAARLVHEGRVLQHAIDEAGRTAEADADFVEAVMAEVRRTKIDKAPSGYAEPTRRRGAARLRFFLNRAAAVAAVAFLALCAHHTFVRDKDTYEDSLLPIRIKKAEAKAIVLKVIQADGQVSVNTPDGKSDLLCTTQILPQHSGISTQDAGRVMFSIDNANFQLNNNSVISSTSYNEAMLNIKLAEGQLNVDCNPERGTPGITIKTDLADIIVYDARCDIQVIKSQERLVQDAYNLLYASSPPKYLNFGTHEFCYDPENGKIYVRSTISSAPRWYLCYRIGFGYLLRNQAFYCNIQTGYEYDEYEMHDISSRSPNHKTPLYGGPFIKYSFFPLMDNNRKFPGEDGYAKPIRNILPTGSGDATPYKRMVIDLIITVSRGTAYIDRGNDIAEPIVAPRRLEFHSIGQPVLHQIDPQQAAESNQWWQTKRKFDPTPKEKLPAYLPPRKKTIPLDAPTDYQKPVQMSISLIKILPQGNECEVSVTVKTQNGITLTNIYTLRPGELAGWYETFTTDRGPLKIDMRSPYILKHIIAKTCERDHDRVVLKMVEPKGVEIYLPRGVELPCPLPAAE